MGPMARNLFMKTSPAGHRGFDMHGYFHPTEYVMTRTLRFAFASMIAVSLLVPSLASAEDETETTDDSATASVSNLEGFQLQARAKTGSLLSKVQPSPGVMFGYRNDRLSIGLSGNWIRFNFSETTTVYREPSPSGSSSSSSQEEITVTGNLIQVLPVFKYDLFVSDDGRSHFGPLLAAGYGVVTSSGERGGESQDLLTVNFVPVRAGVSGEYFFSNHFGIGVEGGLQFGFVTNIESGGEDVDASFGSNIFYGAINAIFVL